MYDWAMKCATCGEINTAEFFPGNDDVCIDCQVEIISDAPKFDQLSLALDGEEKE